MITCLRCLARQGMTLQGNESIDIFTLLIILLGTKDKSIVAHLGGTIGKKYTHHDINNELLNIISHQVFFSKPKTICKNVSLFINGRLVNPHHQ